MDNPESEPRRLIFEPERVTFPDPVQVLNLRVPVGRVNVIGTDGPATLEVNRIVGEPLTIELTDGTLWVRHGAGARPGILDLFAPGRRHQRVDLSLGLPPDANIQLNVVAGTVLVSNFHERVQVRGVSGDVTLAGVHGHATVRTVSGAVTAEQSTGDIDVSGISGAITVLASSGGRINLNTVAGSLTVDMVDPMPRDVRLKCVSGPLTVRLPHDPDVHVDLSAGQGPLTSAVDELSRVGHSLTGTLGTGAARLRGNTISGSVTVLRRGAEDDYDDDIPKDRVHTGQGNEESR
jgi:hypothetical protein